MSRRNEVGAAVLRRSGSDSRSTGDQRVADSAEQQTETPGAAKYNGVHLRFIRFSAVRERTGLSRTTIWRMERRGDFPRHRRISANAVAWIEEEVLDWMRSRAD